MSATPKRKSISGTAYRYDKEKGDYVLAGTVGPVKLKPAKGKASRPYVEQRRQNTKLDHVDRIAVATSDNHTWSFLERKLYYAAKRRIDPRDEEALANALLAAIRPAKSYVSVRWQPYSVVVAVRDSITAAKLAKWLKRAGLR